MEQFTLIFRHEDGKKLASPEQMQNWMKQTMDWMDTIKVKNKLISGTGLVFEDAAYVQTLKGRKVVTDGPFGEIKETLGGFIIVKANTVEEAIEFAMGCPILQEDGNSVEVRKIASGDGIH